MVQRLVLPLSVRIGRWLSLVWGVVLALALSVRYFWLPAIIPIHWNLWGEVDNYGGRWVVFLLAGIVLVLTIGMFALSFYPQHFNYPVEVTEENAERVYREGVRCVVWVTLAMQLLFSVLFFDFFGGWAPSWLLWVGIVLVLISIPIFYWRMKRAGRS